MNLFKDIIWGFGHIAKNCWKSSWWKENWDPPMAIAEVKCNNCNGIMAKIPVNRSAPNLEDVVLRSLQNYLDMYYHVHKKSGYKFRTCPNCGRKTPCPVHIRYYWKPRKGEDYSWWWNSKDRKWRKKKK